MKKNIFCLMATALLGGAVLTSCVSDEPFGDGQGELKMKMVVNSTLTRSGDQLSDQSLADKCVVYVSDTKGLLYKYQGVDNLPNSLFLKSGHYTAEAWTGDSVPASFDKKFYRAYQPFEINTGETTNITINCGIANVVASVAPSAAFKAVVKDYKVTVGHSRGTLDFTEANLDQHGFFMMPYDKDKKMYESDLKYTVEGTLQDGTTFKREGTVFNAERAHEYVLNINYTAPESSPVGGAFISVVIDDHELLIEDTVEISGAPTISGVGYDISKTMLKEPGSFDRCSMFVESLGELRSLKFSTPAYQTLGLPVSEMEFIGTDASTLQAYATAGVSCQIGTTADGQHTARVFMEKEMLNRLPEGTYEIALTAIDANAKQRTRTLTLNVSSAGVIIVASPWQEIYATHATVHYTVTRDDMVNPGIRYRARGETEWHAVYPTTNAAMPGYRRAAGTSIGLPLTGLTPGTTYEYQAIAQDYVNTDTKTFTTESVFTFPNAGFEQWSTGSDKAAMPSSTGNADFWDTGNHGSQTMGKNVTEKATNLFHGGAASAKLSSQFVGLGIIGKFAAGNLFAGTYDKTDGTDGILTFGRPYNGSRPVKLRGWVYYKPASVEYRASDAPSAAPAKGDQDRGTIYVALTTQSVQIKTKASQRTLFDPNASYTLAYGQMIFTGEYGTSSAMREFEITLEYRDAAQLKKATHVVLCCAASQYGDYFTGGSSVMYVDDLEFVY